MQKRICILANSQSADEVGVRVIRALKATSPANTKLEFFGFGGWKMREEGMENYYDEKLFKDKGWFYWRKIKPFHQHQKWRYLPVNIFNQSWVRHNNDVFKHMRKLGVIKELMMRKPHVILSIDNEMLSNKLMEQVNEFYSKGSRERPEKIIYNKMIRDIRPWHSPLLDYIFHKLPSPQILQYTYKQAGEHIGLYGVYEAIRYLYSTSPSLSEKLSPTPHHILLSRTHMGIQLEKLVMERRNVWRESLGIGTGDTVIFVAPGNLVGEVKFSMERVPRAIEEFLLKYSTPTSLSPAAAHVDTFHTVISLQKGSASAEYIKEYLKKNEWSKGRLIVLECEDKEYLDAMAGSDLGIAYNGEMVASCAACHLPTMILLNLPRKHIYWNYIFNRWHSDLNLIADTDVLPEIVGTGGAWYGRITDQLGEWYVNPGVRWDIIRSTEPWLREALCYQSLDREEVKERDLVLEDGMVYDQFKDPTQAVADFLIQRSNQYDTEVIQKMPKMEIKLGTVPQF